MKYFLFKISAYLLVFGVFSVGATYLIDGGLKHLNEGVYGEWNRIFRGEMDDKIVVLGSSRAFVQFSPEIFEHVTGLSCYNMGVNGGARILQKTKWKAYLTYSPAAKYVIQVVDFGSLYTDEHIYGKEQFLPYLSNNIIYNNLKSLDKLLWLDRFVPLFKYHGQAGIVWKALNAYSSGNILEKSSVYKGYHPESKVWNQDFTKYRKSLKGEKVKFDWDEIDNGFEYLSEIAKDCKKRNIQLILVETPYYYEMLDIFPDKQKLDKKIQQFADVHGIPFWNYSEDSLSFNRDLFYNSTHLNKTGAEILSYKAANRLKVRMNQ